MGTLMALLAALFLSAVLIYPVIRRFGRHGFLCAAAILGVSFVVMLLLAPGDEAASGRTVSSESVTEHLLWLPQMGLNLTLHLDQLAWLFALLVTGAGALVLLYCRDYFDSAEEGLARFGSCFLGFAGSMLGLVLADNVYLLFVFWEATTVFSFLLIAHSFRQRTSRASALQALIVTTAGGLAMLIGLVILAAHAGTANLSEILANPPQGAPAHVAVFLVLAGALSKSAIFPFHFWLPGAMAAPTPVSAYLHAAAMVKAGVYLIARFSTSFADVAGFRETLVLLGAITMLNGGIRALRQYDIKLIIAHGTVSQLGLLVMVFGVSTASAKFAGLALLFAHALAKAPLFLVVGIVDHGTGTRDVRELSSLGRQAPALVVVAVLATLSMIGVPPLLGFVAKEAAFTELLPGESTPLLSLCAFVIAVLGSVLTVAYMLRFLWGTFATKPGVHSCTIIHRDAPTKLIAPGLFVALAVVGGIAAPAVDGLLRRAVSAAGQPRAALGHVADEAERLALWHGVTPALMISTAALLAGGLLAVAAVRRARPPTIAAARFSASHMYWLFTHWVDMFAVRLTALTQRGSLPFYLAVILTVMVGALSGTMVVTGEWRQVPIFVATPAQLPIALVMCVAAWYAARAHTRFQAVVLVGVTGYGMAAIFALHGAPDLALTQVLVETVTLIAFVLVIRRLPQRINVRATLSRRWIRAVLGAAVGLTIGCFALLAGAARTSEPISFWLPELAHAGGHGSNVVNVMLVDIRGWDTLGELSVILAAATGVASLIFLRTRVDNLPKLSRRDARLRVHEYLRRVEDPNDPAQRRTWMLAGRNLDPSKRSILLEVMVRLVFHALILLSVYLLFTGHNMPGGGFVGGLVAGLALVARYLTGGRDELGATVTIDAGRILGAGLGLAVTMALLPLLFGQSALASVWVDLDLAWLGTLPFVTSTLFDIGVYLVVFGLVLDVLRSLGAEVDRQEERDRGSNISEPYFGAGGAS